MSKFACIKAVSAYLPEKVESNKDFGDQRFIGKLGITERHIAADDESAGDLAFNAAENLFNKYKINRDNIDFILLCTQHPDYQMPTTACHLQHRLNLPKSAGALDYSLGCSGYVYGLSLAKGLIESKLAKNVLLLTSSIYNKYINKKDKPIRPLFGDGATATLISAEESDKPFLDAFVFGTDGSKYDSLYIPVGGSRLPPRENAEVVETDEHGNIHTNYEVHMDGMAITYFTFRTVPKLVEDVLNKAQLNREDINYYIFHQANHFMMNQVQKKCQLEGLNFYNDITDIGNTVSGTLPFGILHVIKDTPTSNLQKVMLAGFGVGLSWSGCIADLSQLTNEEL
ncbi:MAG: ketoacyl-ACP synthase III [Selenomonadaceae bacterium]|nr:ketoacyl-ACP synthase III [Selenomonadaceae bacterium]MBR1859955.1 ketoacyl-ACP synthase III [Selenomonadaceae bacterium]